ncbi:hypothetical protein ROHU_002539 [Labeo rohita]|uniref:Uncharacterized protein n=1 Tax=Labeo rohita TaxID=84645 RepID=A0A498NZ04_LABRO|nr:hypothetical protein ROHU_002539 [Labeo rohita]
MQAQTLFHQDLFHSFEAMKTAAPGMSVKAFTAMLDQRTKQFGRRYYRFCKNEDPGFFDGVFLAQDSEVSNFVEEVRVAVKSTVEKILEVTGSLKKMQDQLHCCDDMLKQWVVDVKQWASSDRNKRCQKIAQEKKHLLEEIQRYNQHPDGDPVDTKSVVQKLFRRCRHYHQEEAF